MDWAAENKIMRDQIAALEELLKEYEQTVIEQSQKLEERNGELERSIHETKGLQETLIQSEKMAAVGQLAAGVAHEINNPLGIILGFAQSLARRVKADDPSSLPVKSIEREALRCKNLVQNLLTFSRDNMFQAQEFDLNEALTNALSIIEAKARVESVEVVQEFASLPLLLGDKNQIQQVVINLCNNALDAMPHGGKIAVRTRRHAADGKSTIVLEVEDSGSGIPAEIRDKVFNPFFTTKDVGKGTGLGLSLVHEIIQKHNGRIELKSVVGRGTIFTITFPVKPGGRDDRCPA